MAIGVPRAAAGFAGNSGGRTPAQRAAQALLRAHSEGALGRAKPRMIIFRELDRCLGDADDDHRKRCADIALKMMDVWTDIERGQDYAAKLAGSKDSERVNPAVIPDTRDSPGIFKQLQDALESSSDSQNLADVALPPAKMKEDAVQTPDATLALARDSTLGPEIIFQQLDAHAALASSTSDPTSSGPRQHDIASLCVKMQDLCNNCKEPDEWEGEVTDKQKYYEARIKREHTAWCRNTLHQIREHRGVAEGIDRTQNPWARRGVQTFHDKSGAGFRHMARQGRRKGQ